MLDTLNYGLKRLPNSSAKIKDNNVVKVKPITN